MKVNLKLRYLVQTGLLVRRSQTDGRLNGLNTRYTAAVSIISQCVRL